MPNAQSRRLVRERRTPRQSYRASVSIVVIWMVLVAQDYVLRGIVMCGECGRRMSHKARPTAWEG